MRLGPGCWREGRPPGFALGVGCPMGGGGKGFATQEPALLLSQRSPFWPGAGQGLDFCHFPTRCIEIGFPAETVSLNHSHKVPRFSTQAVCSSSVYPKPSPLLSWGSGRKDTENGVSPELRSCLETLGRFILSELRFLHLLNTLKGSCLIRLLPRVSELTSRMC